MTKHIYHHFAKTVDDYDTIGNKVVMKNQELHKIIVDSISIPTSRKITVLDLGSGTGHGMKMILGKYPLATITGIDFSPRMISKSRKNLKKFETRIELRELDFNEMNFEKMYDVVVSAVAIHNSTDSQKRKLFENIYSSLKKGGIFINGDFIKGTTNELNNHYQLIYKQYLKDNLSGRELKVWLRHAFKEDMPMKLLKQFHFLKNIGFKKTELIWQFNNEAIYRTIK